ncbi:MAG: GTP-binding protein [Pseudomonadales bacterium]|nr:GTP-binding protein [Pseudomonadales bacterium]
MKPEHRQLRAIPTNIITGFLGVGKTSTLLHLMREKPAGERWAVLVNEFGEIGIDGSLFQGQYGTPQGVYIREVPGGCMCCAAGLPMQIALNQLLTEAKPDRLLIEPTGLGHPKEVLQVLSSAHYQKALSLQKTLTLVDARKLKDQRYTGHETFNQQIAIADLVIGNKLDLYEPEDKERLVDYVKQRGQPHVQILFTQNGAIDASTLKGTSNSESIQHGHDHHQHHPQDKPLAADVPLPPSGFIKAINEGEGYRSIGWRIAKEKVFHHEKLYAFLTGLQVERMKAVFMTNAGVFGYNLTADALTEVSLDDCEESRVELISNKLDPLTEDTEAQLFACLID